MAKQEVKNKKGSAKATAKKAVTKSSAKPASKKPATPKTTPKKSAAKKPAAKKIEAKKASAAKKPLVKLPAKPVTKKKSAPKVVAAKKPAVKKAASKVQAKAARKPVAAKKAAPKKQPRLTALPAAPAAPLIEWSVAQLKNVKTGFGKKDIEAFRKSLLDHRSEIVGDMQGMEEARNVSAGDLSHMPLHMADVGSDNYEQEFTLGILESERKILNEIDAALERMDQGYYGVCIETGRPIERPRLEVMPWAKYGKEAALRREKQIGG